MRNVLDVLEERGLVEDVTDPGAREAVASPVMVYAGFDPSSDSLQAGNYVTIMVLAHFQRCGHRVIAVVGGATGMIGDPSGKSSERPLLDASQVACNVAGIRENLSRFLDFEHPTAPAKILNNHDWLGGIGYIEFLREVGKCFRMGAMLGRESVRARLSSETGMSYTEFSYQLLQACDFLWLHDNQGCTVQIGGSDQWGNITAGIELIRKLRGSEAYGITMPLVCDSAGQKFGKSEGNAVYLDANRTPIYDFYQFFFRTADADVIRFLKIFTFLAADTIRDLEEQVCEAPEERAAQRALAEEVTRAVHGEEGLRLARRASEALFGAAIEGLHAGELSAVFAHVPSFELARDRVEGAAVVDVAVASGLCASKGEARRLVQSGGLYVNNRRVAGIDARIGQGDIVDERLVVLRSGKRTYRLVRVLGQ